MQHKRQEIIDLLKQQGYATVEQLSKAVGLTSVTVRHHLDVLRSEGLVSEPVVRHRNTSGRPQLVYSLTPEAAELFPHNYDELAKVLLTEIRTHCDNRLANVIFEGVSARLAADAPRPQPGEPMESRIQRAVEFLNQKGYVAAWERRADGYLIQTRNCPFEGLPTHTPELCVIDLNLITALVGTQIKRVCHITEGDSSCAYLAPLAG